MTLQGLVHDLIELVWTQEQGTHHHAKEAILGYVKDAVTVEIEYRRRMRDLDRKRPELERIERTTIPSTSPGAPDAVADESHHRELGEIGRRVATLEQGLAQIADRLPSAVQGVGIVRYNALPEIGGAISFSLALLDGRANGVVVSVLNGRETVRVYGKAIEAGKSSHALSPEELQALALALAGGR